MKGLVKPNHIHKIFNSVISLVNESLGGIENTFSFNFLRDRPNIWLFLVPDVSTKSDA